ncbi:hypothetical protein THTE_1773 [Thermogutta terrifontis]|uniref:Uncharacterized protein n=1 Tax=Thermogutta terrifontis TaxID=1331910 RepID=A0A286REH7_9BACT|nr:hypothetical protein THTE_1773 [Thermogutta terrifontis]
MAAARRCRVDQRDSPLVAGAYPGATVAEEIAAVILDKPIVTAKQPLKIFVDGGVRSYPEPVVCQCKGEAVLTGCSMRWSGECLHSALGGVARKNF